MRYCSPSLLAAWFAFAGLAPAFADPPASGEKLKVLIIDGQNNHNWKETTPHLKRILEASGRFAVDVATTPDKPKPLAKGDKSDESKAQFVEATVEYKKALAGFSPPIEQYAAVLSNY